MNPFLNAANTTQESAAQAKWQKTKELIDHPYYSVEWPDIRSVTYGLTIFGEPGLCHQHENSWEVLENTELVANYKVYVFPLQKRFKPLTDKKLINFAKHFLPEAYKDDGGQALIFKKKMEEKPLEEIKLSKLKHKRTTLYLDFAIVPLNNKFITAAGKILILNKKDVFVLFVGPCKKLSRPDYEKFVDSFRPEGLMEKEPEYPSKYYYEGLLQQKSFYIKQQHCLESLWGHGFHRNYEKSKTLFYEALIRESLLPEKVRTKNYLFLLNLVKENWETVFELSFTAKPLTETEYLKKNQTTFYQIEVFARRGGKIKKASYFHFGNNCRKLAF